MPSRPFISFGPLAVPVSGFEWAGAGDVYTRRHVPDAPRPDDPAVPMLVPKGWQSQPMFGPPRLPVVHKAVPPTLFLEAAETEPTLDGILQFANRYGLLGRPELGVMDEAELFGTWRTFLTDLKSTVELQVEIQKAKAGIADITRRMFRKPLTLAEAEDYFRATVSGHLYRTITARLVLTAGAKPMNQLVMHASGLSAIAWLQLGDVADEAQHGGKRLRRCIVCEKKWLPLQARESMYRDRTTCSNACRQQLYLRRRAEKEAKKQAARTKKRDGRGR